MKRCAYLTMENNDFWTIDADLAFPYMEMLGWQVKAVPWRNASCDWNKFDAVYVGTPWDYPEAPQQFMHLLQEIDESKAILVNDLALVRWTLTKIYLRDLEERGADIVPSLWFDDFAADQLTHAFDEFSVDTIIIKPVVSTNATDTYLLRRELLADVQANLQSTFRKRPFVVQPFIENIQSDGEYSLFYFDAKFSHGIRKVPKESDFRVQEEYGAEITSLDPEAALIAAGNRIFDLVEPTPVYARVDFVRSSGGRFLLMELELIEPSMYLRMNEKAPRRFAEAFDNHVKIVTGK